MFGNLKKKLQGFLGKSKETEEIAKIDKEKTPKAKQSKAKLLEKPKKLDKKQESLSNIPIDSPKENQSISEKSSFIRKFTSKISTTTLTQQQVDEILEPLELILLENNVALETVDKIKEVLSSDLVGIEIKKSEIEKTIQESLKESISSVLINPPNLVDNIKKKKGVFVIAFFGINGSGKTTSLAKIAYKLKSEKISCVLAAADTFRAASIEQLETHANNLGLKLIKQQYGADPTAVAFDAKKYAEKNGIKCVLIDTAGRMYTKENLIKEMEKLVRVIQPDLKIFVGESITGNDVTQQAKTFNEAIEIDGIILTKSDVDEKGGSSLSISQITHKPIYFLGTGQSYSDLKTFKKSEILKSLGLS